MLLRDRLFRRSVMPQLWMWISIPVEVAMSSQKTDELDVFEMFYASVGPSLWDDLRQPIEEDSPVEVSQHLSEEDCFERTMLD